MVEAFFNFFIREAIPVKLLCLETSPIEGLYVEMNLYKN